MLNQVYAHETFSHRATMGLDPEAYSKFKYGCKAVAREYGTSLAHSFCQNMLKQDDPFKGKQVVVYSSPYMFIPTATFALKDYFIATCNEYLICHGYEPIIEGKILRKPSYTQDYGKMSVSEREKAISGDDFYIDAEYAKDKFCIFLDDIRITGAHERRIAQMLTNAELTGIDGAFVYYALFEPNPDMPEGADIEDYLNLYAIDGIDSINRIIKSAEGFIFNTRVVKYILSFKPQIFKMFLEDKPISFLRTLYQYSLGNGYYKADEFATNFSTLKEVIRPTGSIPCEIQLGVAKNVAVEV